MQMGPADEAANPGLLFECMIFKTPCAVDDSGGCEIGPGKMCAYNKLVSEETKESARMNFDILVPILDNLF